MKMETPRAAPSGSTIWNALPIPALVVDRHDQIRQANPEAETFLNRSAKQLSGMKLHRTLHIDADVAAALQRARQHGATVMVADVEIANRHRGTARGDVQVAPIDPRHGNGDVILVITPREMASRAGAVAGGRSAIGMAEMLAHEIKNPLAGITGAAQLLSMNLSDGDRELTDLIVAESRRIVALLDQVEQFGNVRPPEKRPVNVHDVIDRAKRSARVGFGAHMTFEEDYDPSLPPTAADPDQLLQVMLNLLKNASQAAVRDGRIRLRTYYDGALRVRREDGARAALPLQVEVIDDGPGLPEELKESAFEPFVSGRENGTGLGLALVNKIVRDHGGWVALESVPGRTVVRISLPVWKEGEH